MNATEPKQSTMVSEGARVRPSVHQGEEKRAPHAAAQAMDEHDLPKDLPRPSTALVVVVVVVFLALLAGLFVLGWVPHQRAAEQTQADAAEQAALTPIASVIHPKPEASSKDVVLPCDVRANQQTAIYARSNGYLKQWFFDIGSQVKKDDLLAVIAAPDVDAQLAQSKAALAQAKATVVKSEADLVVAQTDYQRYLTAQKDNPGSVTQEDIDTKRAAYADAAGALAVAKASVDQGEATVQQLSVTQGFEQITAPFSGTITARNYDVGALINSNGPSVSKELFDIADTSIVRVFVNVPQTYATDIKTGQPAYLNVRNYPQREFQGTVTRMTGALDPNTRTLPFELDFNNPDGTLYAGMYGQARLPVSEAQPTLVIPSSALIFNATGVQVAIVRDGKAHFQPITVGRDMGTQLEVSTGLSTDDVVITNPGERLVEGISVQTKPADH